MITLILCQAHHNGRTSRDIHISSHSNHSAVACWAGVGVIGLSSGNYPASPTGCRNLPDIRDDGRAGL